MKTEAAKVGARGIDSLPFSMGGTAAQAKALKADGIDFVVGYLGVINATRVQYVLDAGLAFMAVTLGGRYDGPTAVQQIKGLGLSENSSVWLDLEGLDAFHTDPTVLASKVNDWSKAIVVAKQMPCLYVGVPQPFTSDELWSLATVRYWRGQGSIRDRKGALAEPTRCGWCQTQMYPSVVRDGVLVDFNIIGQDYLQRVPNWVVA